MPLNEKQLFNAELLSLLLGKFHLGTNTGTYSNKEILTFDKSSPRSEYIFTFINNSKNIIIPFIYFSGRFEKTLTNALVNNQNMFNIGISAPYLSYQTGLRIYERFLGCITYGRHFGHYLVGTGIVLDREFKKLLIFTVLDVTNKKIIIYVSKSIFVENHKKLLPLYKKIEKELFSNKYVEYVVCNSIEEHFNGKSGINVVPHTDIAQELNQLSNNIIPLIDTGTDLILQASSELLIDMDNIYKHVFNEKVSDIKPSKLHLILQRKEQELLLCQQQESTEMF